MGATQVGKFLTIYPRSDDESRQLAATLIEMTEGFRGPIIVSDLRLGEITYTRYGAFDPLIMHDRLGQMLLCIKAPDGTLRVDSQPVPFSPPAGVSNPFKDWAVSNGRAATERPDAGAPLHVLSSSDKLFGPGYLILEVIAHRPKGSVFRAIDLRDYAEIGPKIIKQGRQHCLSDEWGRDIRTRLRHQEALHDALAGLVPVARADPYFEVDGDGYLPLEDIAGETVESFVFKTLKSRAWSSLSPDEHMTFLILLDQLVAGVQQMHANGYVHRDLSASNIWIGADERVYLLDLELASRVGDKSPAFGLGTPGFMSPAQERGESPTPADDIYALGCVMLLCLTGLDPRRVPFSSDKDRVHQLLSLTNSAPFSLVETIAQCVSPDPTARPSLDRIKATLQHCLRDPAGGGLRRIEPGRPVLWRTVRRRDGTYADLIRGGLDGLLQEAITDDDSGLWVSAAGRVESHGAVGGSFRLCRDANRGVAGIVYLLGRLARFGYTSAAARDRVRRATEWLLLEHAPGDIRLPGLHFGDAGIAVALVEAIAGRLIDRDARVNAFLSNALSGRLDWPDITHGAAGQGVAAIYCADRLGDASVLSLAHRCAAFLVDCQKDDGSWEMPAGVDGMSGETLTGFAHGVSGIVYFLAEYARRTGSWEASKSCEAGVNWLLQQAVGTDDGEALEWPYSNVHRERWKWWCHGSPGVALTFLRLVDHTGNGIYAETARKALRVHPADMRYPNLSQCHGLSGLAEIYLEAGRVLGEQEWFDRAENIAAVLMALRREKDSGSVTWLVEDPYVATADLMVGSGSVIHFFLRLSMGAKDVGFPLLLDPCSC